MTELFESNITFVILAIIVGVRLVLYLRRRAADRQAREKREDDSPMSGIAAKEAEEEFSAWALDVDREHVPPPPVPAPPAKVKNLVVEPVMEFAPPVEILQASRPRAGSAAFWERLKTLAPLRQGVILSEILGPPKGL